MALTWLCYFSRMLASYLVEDKKHIRWRHRSDIFICQWMLWFINVCIYFIYILYINVCKAHSDSLIFGLSVIYLRENSWIENDEHTNEFTSSHCLKTNISAFIVIVDKIQIVCNEFCKFFNDRYSRETVECPLLFVVLVVWPTRLRHT